MARSYLRASSRSTRIDGKAPATGRLPRMDEIFWIPIGIVVLSTLMGAYYGGRSTTANAKTGLLIGFFLSFMSTLPLIAIGLANT